MTKLTSSVALDFRNINFGTADNYANFTSMNDANFASTTNVGTVFGKDLAVYYNGPLSAITSGAVLLGSGFHYDANQNATAGTMTGFSQYFGDDAFGNAYEFVAFGFSVSLTSFQSIMRSASLTDDRALMASIFTGNDSMIASDEADYLRGYAGNDTIHAGGGNDSLLGEAGNDTLSGDAGLDAIYGGSGDDRMFGANDKDALYGGLGHDTLLGGTGTDRLFGGVDTVRDVFQFIATEESARTATADTIYNFVHGIDDIDLSTIDANASLAGNQAFAFHGTTAAAHSVWLGLSGTNIYVYADTTGDTSAELRILVKDVSQLTAADFVL